MNNICPSCNSFKVVLKSNMKSKLRLFFVYLCSVFAPQSGPRAWVGEPVLKRALEGLCWCVLLMQFPSHLSFSLTSSWIGKLTFQWRPFTYDIMHATPGCYLW